MLNRKELKYEEMLGLVNDHYRSEGIDPDTATAEEKLTYWEVRDGGKANFYTNVSNDERVATYELDWLFQNDHIELELV